MRILKRLGFVFKRKKADMLFMDARFRKHDIPPRRHAQPRSDIRDTNTVLHNTCPPRRFAEVGRSMVEMLGVLAIIGVLSIAAVAGYRFALTKFRANEVTNELNMRALSASAQMLNAGHTYILNEIITDGFKNTLAVGYPAETAVSDRNADYFEIIVQNIPADLCRQILRDYQNPIMIFVNDILYNNDTSVCGTNDTLNDMGFVFKNDLGTHESCSEKGYFGEEDFQCHCSGNTYLDIYTNDCLCPAGHVWSAAESTCIESICPEGQFESLTDGCVSCDDTTTYTIATDERHKQLCAASTCGRIVVGSNCVNQDVNNCIPGESFRTSAGTCASCNTTANSVASNRTQELKDSCNACSERLWAGGNCIKKNMCSDTQFYQFNGGSGLVRCLNCSDPTPYLIIYNTTYPEDYQLMVDSCAACTNSAGDNNRRVINNYCVKTVCDSGEFMGADGKCYACSHTTKIEVGTESGCEDTACGRKEAVGDDGKTYCQITDCPTDGTYANIDGSCYPCTGSTPFSATKTQCAQCTSSKRLWLGTDNADGTAKGQCMISCTSGSSYPYISASFCYTCTGFKDGAGYAGISATAREYCEACGNYLDGAWCVSPDSCTRGSEFRRKISEYTFCTSCSIVDKTNIGTTSGHRDMCRACTTTPRFWMGEYCYRCDTAETPDVTSEEEEKSCNSCAEREIKDGKCILRQ